MRKNKGFTLIELLVVIAIIGILATLAVVSLSSARMKSRDARRVSDVRQMQVALDMYFNDAGSYPPTSASGGSNPIVSPGTSIAYGGTTYLAAVPANQQPYGDCGTTNNPLGGTLLSVPTSYTYAAQTVSGGTTPVATTYSLLYCLGGATGTLTAGVHYATPAGIANP